ncbi:MAG: hypothetical protein WAU00_00250 [Caldilinea sp.]|nr:hypothetical protein [Anaerolineales bacterium]
MTYDRAKPAAIVDRANFVKDGRSIAGHLLQPLNAEAPVLRRYNASSRQAEQ